MLSYLIPLAVLLLGMVSLIIYVLGIALRDVTRQVTQMNERLLVLLGTRDGGEAVGRALVASARPPVKPTPGLAATKPEKKDDNKGLTMKMGVN